MARMNTNGLRFGVALVALVLATRGVFADPHTFTFDARNLNPKASKVYLAGSFNGWNPIGQVMEEKGGVWSLTVELPQGVHFYKFVADGTRWINDPQSDKALEESDGNGGMNSAVLVGPDARKAPVAKKNHINRALFVHNSKEVIDADNAGDGQLRLRVRVQKGDVERVSVKIGGATAPLHWMGAEMGMDAYGGLVNVPQGASTYSVIAEDGSAREVIEGGVVPPERMKTPAWTKHAVWYQIFPERFRNGDPSNDPKGEFEHPIRWTSNWWETQPGEVPGPENFYRGAGNVWQRRYGGDIQGIREKLPYLRSLGITAIYLNPIFEASSMHKYDTRDYRHVDDNLTVREELPLAGETEDPATWKWSKGDKLFFEFVEEAHKQGFKVVLDGVFNHVGKDHPFFQDVVQKGAASKYADWFEIESYPATLPAKDEDFGKPGGLNYKAWDKPSGSLPAFRKDPKTGLAKGPYEHVMAITKRWLAPDGDPKKGIDGWRLDVANDIPHPFWVEWRKLVKETNPEAYISGEIWQPAQPWLKGDQFDAVMNYQFAMPAQRFFVNQKEATTPTVFSRELNRLVAMYPLQASLSMMNLYDSHDTDRLSSMFVNPDRPYDGANRLQDSDPNYSPAMPDATQWARFTQAVDFQMFFLGAPMVYYGSEAGMWSPDDPSNRMPMVWKDLEPFDDKNVRFYPQVFAAYQRAIAVRQALPALQTGYVRTVSAVDDAGTLVLARELGNSTVYLAVNRSPQKRVISVDVESAVGGGWVNWMEVNSIDLDTSGARPVARISSRATTLQARQGILTVSVPAWGTAVLSPTDRAVAERR